MNKKLLFTTAVIIGVVASILYFFVFYKQAEMNWTERQTIWTFETGHEIYDIEAVEDDYVFVQFGHSGTRAIALLDRKTGKPVWRLEDIKTLLDNTEHYYWNYYLRGKYLYFRDWIGPYKEDKFILTKIDLMTGQIIWQSPKVEGGYVNLRKLTARKHHNYICLVPQKDFDRSTLFVFDDATGKPVIQAIIGLAYDHKSFLNVDLMGLSQYDISDFMSVGRQLVNLKDTVYWQASSTGKISQQLNLMSDQLVQISSQFKDQNYIYWFQSFDWATGKRKVNLSIASKQDASSEFLHQDNFAAFVEKGYHTVTIWNTSTNPWTEVHKANLDKLYYYGISDHEFWYETQDKTTKERIINVFDFEDQSLYQPKVRFPKDFRVDHYIIDNQTLYQETEVFGESVLRAIDL